MSSPNKKEWKNPKDIMRVHRIKRQSSASLSHSKSSPAVTLSRRNSMSSLSRQKSRDLSDLVLHSSNSEEAIASTKAAGTQKRKNPFSCDSATSHVRKRRSILDEGVQSNITSPVSHGVEQDSTSIKFSTKAQSSDSPQSLEEVSLNNGDGVTQPSNKLLHILNLAEQQVQDDEKSYQGKPSRILSPEKREKPVTRVSTNILKETSNTQKLPPLSNQSKLVADEQEIVQVHTQPPIDWSLKVKMRVVVHSKVESFQKQPGIDAKHVESFAHHRLKNAVGWCCLDLLQKIRRCCFHYSYPQIPWLATFPRLSADFKSRSNSLIATSEEAVEAFQRDWSNAFTSVYQQLRSGVCPYFYTCAHQFTVLFRCQRSSSGASFSALLSSSTRGLREMLTKDDIEFRMPNIRTSKSSKTSKSRNSNGNQAVDKNSENDSSLSQQDEQCQDDSSTNVENPLNGDKGERHPTQESPNQTDENESKKEENEDDSDEDDNDDIDDHYGASRWLEGMGLDKKDFPSLEPLKVKLQREGFRDIDNRPQSMIYVEGPDVHTFFNFLLNYPSCIASSGPQHGIPPTLLSPTPFVGGTLVQNCVKHSTIKEALSIDDRPVKDVKTHVFEISGPILPHHSLNIASVLHNCPENISSTVSYNTHFPTASLNTQAVNQVSKDRLTSALSKLFVDFSLANPGLIDDVQDRLVSLPVLDNGTAVREMNVSDSGFSWKC